ncbi:MAG: hypothetical protein K6T99_11100 [Armatimonadetes bacterium]|nr:hypothetical protein [Armatimonadota bacterium]
MSLIIKKHYFWLIPLCLLFSGLGVFIYWQQEISAQNPPAEPPPPNQAQSSVTGAPVDSGAQPGSIASVPPPTPTEPVYGLKQVVSSGIKVVKIKNWDGSATEILRFKYKSMDGRIMTVHLPAVYKNEKRTRAGWNTLFTCYAMDYEAMLDQIERNKPPDVSAFMNQLVAEISGQVPEGTFEKTTAGVEEAMDVARHYLPGMGIGDISLPPLLPGMP